MLRLTVAFVASFAFLGVVAIPASGNDAAQIARTEYQEVMNLVPDLGGGRKAYLACAACHGRDAWGTADGVYPQIAGQFREVVVKQVADIRARSRASSAVCPLAASLDVRERQRVADVAAYIEQLPMTAHNGAGPGTDLELGERLYAARCADCHGRNGEGRADRLAPELAGQHYLYLMRQFDALRRGQRRNADPECVTLLSALSPLQQSASLDYASRLPPPAGKAAVDQTPTSASKDARPRIPVPIDVREIRLSAPLTSDP